MSNFSTITYRPTLTVQRCAWTGGDVPPRDWFLDAHHRALCRAFFRESASYVTGMGPLGLSVWRVLWNRAKLDAWRTLKH